MRKKCICEKVLFTVLLQLGSMATVFCAGPTVRFCLLENKVSEEPVQELLNKCNASLAMLCIASCHRCLCAFCPASPGAMR